MKTSLFDYNLPPELIAQKSVQPRDSSKLMILDRQTGAIEHKIFRDIVNYLKPGDLLVMNDTKVFKARLHVKLPGSEAEAEIFLVRPLQKKSWLVLARPGKKLTTGMEISFGEGLNGTVMTKNEDGTVEIQFNQTPANVIKLANKLGEIPIPPYVSHVPGKLEDYQTVYAKHTGSVAAPTAGFHFTPALLAQIKKKGIKIKFVTLHVGLGTFQPIKSENIEEHNIHSEWAEIPADTSAAIRKAKKSGGRVIAVGTTTVRTLEGFSETKSAGKKSGWINIFIKPGYKFRVVDAIITNFHLPKSSLLVLVAAFAGHDNILRAYETAIVQKYRFYSFGDAMFIK